MSDEFCQFLFKSGQPNHYKGRVFLDGAPTSTYGMPKHFLILTIKNSTNFLKQY